MSILTAIINGIRNGIKFIRFSNRAITDRTYAVHLALEKIKYYVKMFVKAIFYEILIFGVVLVALIMAAGATYQFFSFAFLGDSEAVYNLMPGNLEDEDEEGFNLCANSNVDCPTADPYGRKLKGMLESWAYSITKKDIDEMQKAGGGVHPKKAVEYVDIELESYKDNVVINIPVETETFIDGVSQGVEESEEEYGFMRGDAAYPHRFWWQSLAGLDSINDTAIDDKNRKLINSASSKLEPKFVWTDPMTEEYDCLDKYERTSNYELIITNTVTTFVESYVDGQLTDETQIDVVTTKWHPLPLFLQTITMFKDTVYMLGQTHNVTVGTPVTTVNTWTETHTVTGTRNTLKMVDGELVETKEDYEEEIEVEYSTVTTVTNRIDTESWSVAMTMFNHLTTFFDFLEDSKINTEINPEIIYYMAETMPQSFDFIREYGDYLEYASNIKLGGFKGGIGGGFNNVKLKDYEILPSDFIRNIPLFIQTDKRWGYVPYSYTNNPIHGTIGTSGCGPANMAMAITGLGGYSKDIDLNNDGIIDPYEASKYSLDKGHRIYGSGTAWGFFRDIGRRVGLNVKQVSSRGYKEVLEALQKGNPVIASMGPGVFTREGHYITLVGIDASGQIIVNDSNSVLRSNKSWNFERVILPQAKQFFIISK
ncbi:MAG: C39 family peptidase [Bacilli bacterium]|nr:C39 family peptidase [Bacilli bacterium]